MQVCGEEIDSTRRDSGWFLRVPESLEQEEAEESTILSNKDEEDEDILEDPMIVPETLSPSGEPMLDLNIKSQTERGVQVSLPEFRRPTWGNLVKNFRAS